MCNHKQQIILERITMRLQKSGLPSLTAFAKANEPFTLDELAFEFGNDISPIQIEKMMREEIDSQEDLNYFVQTMLVRGLRKHCPKGWLNCHEKCRLIAIGHWGGGLRDRFASAVQKVVYRLRNLAHVPPEWVPSSPADPIIIELFQGICFAWTPTGPGKETGQVQYSMNKKAKYDK